MPRNMLPHQSRVGVNRGLASSPLGNRIKSVTSLPQPHVSDVTKSMTIAIEGSFDSGSTFRTLVSSTWVGGSLDLDGNPIGPTVGTQISGIQPDEIRVMIDTSDSVPVGVDITETNA